MKPRRSARSGGGRGGGGRASKASRSRSRRPVAKPVRRARTVFVQPAADQPADPAFPKGVTVAGRDVFKTRTVYENGKVLHQDFFASHYAPVWGGPLVDPDPPKP